VFVGDIYLWCLRSGADVMRFDETPIEELKDYFRRTYAFRLKPLNVDEVDDFLEFLAREFNVPKPNYQIFKVTRIKKLDPIETKLGGVLKIRTPDPIRAGAFFNYAWKIPYISFLFRGTKGISRKAVIHEFFHYLHYLKEGERAFPDLSKGLSKEALEKWAEEEKRTERETNEFWKKYRERIISKVKMTRLI